MNSPEKLQEAITTVLSLATENSWVIVTPGRDAFCGKGLTALIARAHKLEEQGKLMSHLTPAAWQVHPGDSKKTLLAEGNEVTNGKELRKEAVADAEKVKQAQAAKLVKESMPMFIENYKLRAKIIRIKFDALVSEGFTPEQAVELCKNEL